MLTIRSIRATHDVKSCRTIQGHRSGRSHCGGGMAGRPDHSLTGFRAARSWFVAGILQRLLGEAMNRRPVITGWSQITINQIEPFDPHMTYEDQKFLASCHCGSQYVINASATIARTQHGRLLWRRDRCGCYQILGEINAIWRPARWPKCSGQAVPHAACLVALQGPRLVILEAREGGCAEQPEQFSTSGEQFSCCISTMTIWAGRTFLSSRNISPSSHRYDVS